MHTQILDSIYCDPPHFGNSVFINGHMQVANTTMESINALVKEESEELALAGATKAFALEAV
jgi:hypothetical protein